MKMRFFVPLLILFSLSIVAINAQGTSDRYVYLVLNPDGSASVEFLDPLTLEMATFASIPVAPGETIRRGFLSPSDEWIALQIYSGGESALRLFSLDDEEMVNVIDQFTFPRPPLMLSLNLEVVTWSPDGQYFAFHFQTATEGQSTYVYNVSTRTLTDLSIVDANQYHLAWSPDSSRLALFTMSCEEMGCARATIDIFAAGSGVLSSSIDLSMFSINDFGESLNFCQLRWSLDSAYLSFFNYCDPSRLGVPREVQLVNIATGIITPVTNLTPTDINPAESIFTTTVQTTWANAETLFIGLEKLEGSFYALPGTRSAFTLAYNRTGQTASVIDVRKLGEWARANDQLFAYLAYEYVTNTEGRERLSANVETAFFDGQTLVPLGSGPSGCLLSWNRDASILAYIEEDVRAVWECDGRFERLYFVADDERWDFSVTEPAIALGWLTIPHDNPPPTITPTPSPTHTPTPTCTVTVAAGG